MLHHASLPTSVPKELCTVLCIVSSVTLAAVGFYEIVTFSYSVAVLSSNYICISATLYNSSSRGTAESRLG